ncbi:MAG TPA: cryptochrome/photolyase family protein, partial [Gemmatales bacterium]|nr:cryptochrome/photolyase family protein [Gemmatales bacterium]
MRIALIYPHQLYHRHPALRSADHVFLIEDPLYFRQYPFHRQKLMLHRASMKRFADEIISLPVSYIEADQLKHSSDILTPLKKLKASQVVFVQLNDDWLHARLTHALRQADISYTVMPDPYFLTSDETFQEFAKSRKKLFFTEFYIQQRLRLNILLKKNGKPRGGHWSFDADNRKKLPKTITIPSVHWPKEDCYAQEARSYVRERFPHAPGDDLPCLYPNSQKAANAWLNEFISTRLSKFGDYEDAIHPQEKVLFHSVLTPMLNIGLLSPMEVVEAALEVEDKVPLNSLEGFLRQVIGWREFIRGTYHHLGRRQRSTNAWQHIRPMPRAFYTGTSGIDPVDDTIRQVLKTGYCHHIERLMLLGNIFCLCEIHPDAVYQWFMELFIDAYDWVMVPNVYGMSQHADGGLMTTKPYLSGSAYVLKMSNYSKG